MRRALPRRLNNFKPVGSLVRHRASFRDAEGCRYAGTSAIFISVDDGNGRKGVTVKLCVYLKMQCLLRRMDLPAVDIVFNGRVRKEGVGCVVFVKL